MAVKAKKRLDTIQEREAELRQRLESLEEEERELSSQLGSALASGSDEGEVTSLRERRREVREEVEDLANALPFVERDVRAASREYRAATFEASMGDVEGKAQSATEALEGVFSIFQDVLSAVRGWKDAEADLKGAIGVAERHRRALAEVGDAPDFVRISRDAPLHEVGVIGDKTKTRILRGLEEMVDQAEKSKQPEYQR